MEIKDAGGKMHTDDNETVVAGIPDYALAGSNGCLRIHVVGRAYLRVNCNARPWDMSPQTRISYTQSSI